MNVEGGIQLGDIGGIVRRRGKVAAMTALVAMLAAYWIAMALPNEFSSYATVLVTPQTVDPDLVAAGVPESDLSARLSLMTAQILSRGRLSRIIDDLKLYEDESSYMLREEINTRLESRFPDGPPIDAVVCSDVWRLNDESLSQTPTISIGGPGVNALTAYLGDKLSSVFVIEDRLIIQADLEYDDISACCWGMDHELTVSAVDAFIERYLDGFLDAALRQSGVIDS